MAKKGQEFKKYSAEFKLEVLNRNRKFWCKGYYVDTVGKNTAKIKEYIQNQLYEDKLGEQLAMDLTESPFT